MRRRVRHMQQVRPVLSGGGIAQDAVKPIDPVTRNPGINVVWHSRDRIAEVRAEHKGTQGFRLVEPEDRVLRNPWGSCLLAAQVTASPALHTW
jgi:hypothetical protein